MLELNGQSCLLPLLPPFPEAIYTGLEVHLWYLFADMSHLSFHLHWHPREKNLTRRYLFLSHFFVILDELGSQECYLILNYFTTCRSWRSQRKKKRGSLGTLIILWRSWSMSKRWGKDEIKIASIGVMGAMEKIQQ